MRIRLGGDRSLLVRRRCLVVVVALLALALAVAVLAVLTGAYNLSAADAVRVLAGGGSDLDRFIVLGQRLPRVVAAALIGAMLALSGALFQSLSRNPLGSPDIVGFTTGATTGGLLIILLSAASSTTTIALGTTLGGFATAAAVVAVAARRGGAGEVIVLAGIALSQTLSAFNDYLLTRATIEEAEVAKAWQYGSLNAITWAQVRPLALGAAVLIPLAVWFSRPAAVLEMGDDAAASLGVGVGRLRAAMVGYGVVLAAVCVSVAGPIGFLALAAPQLAQRLARTPGLTLAVSAAMGTALLLIADLLAQRLLAPFQIPVGLLSAACGGLYLMWLLGVRGMDDAEGR
ncbi:iron chelate uptake ABC transporter family permease subunit [Actinomyces sp. MRS3W]|nr:iron chelate uptake ABC transporter family permease subunit [Actinomyces sp. MRS3W]MDU0348234.1 iron chelate uptake ABC transporter family permease subunit [Actinomyces sp. MRS3W]